MVLEVEKKKKRGTGKAFGRFSSCSFDSYTTCPPTERTKVCPESTVEDSMHTTGSEWPLSRMLEDMSSCGCRFGSIFRKGDEAGVKF
jgi:hypothetical protein